MQRIVCITGYKQSGKDYITNIMKENYGYKHLQIAHRLKEVLRIMFGFNEEQLHGTLKETVDPVWKITPRRAMEFVGTEIGQYDMQKVLPGIGRNFWIKSIINDISTKPLTSNHIISDVRFPHEVDELKKSFPNMYICVVRIKNPEISLNSKHSSELSIDKIKPNFIFINNQKIYSKTIESVHDLEIKILCEQAKSIRL